MKAAFLQRQAKENPEILARAFRVSLVDFGYTTLSQERVQEAVQHWTEGKPASGIIEMFVHKWLENGTDD